MPTVRPVLTRSIVIAKDNFNTDITSSSGEIDILENKYNLRSIKDKHKYRSSISQNLGAVRVEEFLPFRVKFTNIGVGGYTVAPIGIAIIGYNNYIL